MSKKERQNSAITNGNRRERIAMGSGVEVSKCRRSTILLRQRAQMFKMFKAWVEAQTASAA